jgi:tetratricopeptide (TPR) repeat protein
MKFNKVKYILYLFIWLCFPLLSFGADGGTDLFKEGNTYYTKAKYKEALASYQKILDKGDQSAGLYFNMGNASYKDGDIPSALLYYEKARKLSPGDEDINFNIRFANLKTTDKIEEAPEFFLTKWLRSFMLALSLSALSVLSIVLVLVASGILVVYFFSNSVAIKKTAFYSAIVLFIVGAFTIFIAGMQSAYFNNNRQAIIFSGSVTVKSGPLDKAGNLFVLHDGTKVNILESNNEWIKIRLANGNEGWMKMTDVKMI